MTTRKEAVVFHICEDGGSYPAWAGYSYWSAYLDDRKIDFAAGSGSEAGMRKTVLKYYPAATIIVDPSRVKEEIAKRFGGK